MHGFFSFSEDEPVRIIHTKNRGRGIVALRYINEGEIIFRDSPFLLSIAEDAKSQFCSHCFRSFSSFERSKDDTSSIGRIESNSAIKCHGCEECWYCNPHCLSMASNLSHPPHICHLLSRLRHTSFNDESKSSIRFLSSAYNLINFKIQSNNDAFLNNFKTSQIESSQIESSQISISIPSPNATPLQTNPKSESKSKSRFDLILDLTCNRESEMKMNEDDVIQMHTFISQNLNSFPHSLIEIDGVIHPLLSLKTTWRLISIDGCNSFGLMAPFSPGMERKLRGSGIYLRSSMLNHDCIPNACRFDYIDSSSSYNLELQIRAMRSIKKGEEICISYFPINWNMEERKRRLIEDYGFDCVCRRCKIESEWSSGEEDEEEDGEEEDGEEEDGEEEEEKEKEKEEDGEDVDGEDVDDGDGEKESMSEKLQEANGKKDDDVNELHDKNHSGYKNYTLNEQIKGKYEEENDRNDCNDDNDDGDDAENHHATINRDKGKQQIKIDQKNQKIKESRLKDDNDSEGIGMDDDDNDDGIDEDELMMFFVKYVCPEEGCGGTMAATCGVWNNEKEDYVSSDVMECNLCGRLRTNDEFMHDLMSNGIIE